MCSEQIYLMIVLTTKQWIYGYIVCGWSKVMFLWYFIIISILNQMQGFFKDMNTIWNVLNIGQPVLQTMIVLSLVFRVLKKWQEGSVISAKIIVKKTVIYTICNDIDKNNSSDTLSVSLP